MPTGENDLLRGPSMRCSIGEHDGCLFADSGCPCSCHVAESGLRPWCCPEPRCEPLHVHAEVVAPGESFICFGKAPESVEFTYDGVTHANDLRSCHYTPLKGLIAYQENRDDWEGIRAGYWRALAALTTRVIPPVEGDSQ